MRQSLPIDRLIPEILSSMEKHSGLVLQATPGSGKTTRVPPALLQIFRKGEILVLEPRRLAAKMAARRVAEELGERVGETVGYQFRFENVGSPSTRLRFLTEGMLMRRLLGDRELHGVSVVILDEFHERHLHGDIAFAFLRRLQRERRPDLKIIVMSATLDAAPIAAFLGGCPVIKAELPQYEVKLEYLSSPPSRYLDHMVRDAVRRALAADDIGGDILVFLPGMADIRRAESLLQSEFGREILVTPLHGDLSRDEQDLAIQKADRTKVILSTNLAETSLTIEGVNTVIDSGLQRTASYSWWSGVPALRTRPTSRASAIQRMGRAGRTGPGRCYRLYTRGEFDSRAPFDVPEIQRADLSQTVLELKELGVTRLEDFQWYETPSPQSLQSVCELLFRLGALSASELNAELTALGRQMAAIPAHPRIARVMIEAARLGVEEDAATLCALIYEGALDGLDALAQLESGRFGEGVRKTRSQLLSALREAVSIRKRESKEDPHRRLRQSVLAGFPDRVAQKRIPSGKSDVRRVESELVLSSGGNAWVAEMGVVTEGEMFVILDVQERQGAGQLRSKIEVRSVSLIDPDWLLDLEPTLVKDIEEVVWDSERKRVQGSSRMVYDQLVLSESLTPPANPAQAMKVLLKEGLGLSVQALENLRPSDLIQALAKAAQGVDAEVLESTMARFELVAKYFPSLGVPELSGDHLAAMLARALHGRFSLRDLQEVDWASALLTSVSPEIPHRLDQLVPTQVTLVSGRKTRVHYKLGQAPWVESRLQDFFGMKQGPSILEGRIPLALHLLAPNQRAVQITTDLAGFWQRTYPDVRRELCRRYPRHKWPENPLSAEALASVERRK